MRRPLAGVGRDVQNASERHIGASKAPRDLPHNGVADTGTENRSVCGHSSTREHQQRTVHVGQSNAGKTGMLRSA